MTKIHLSQKKTCGNYDRGSQVFGGCVCSEYVPYRQFGDLPSHHCCTLGFKCPNKIPLEPCYKPLTNRQLTYAYELIKENKQGIYKEKDEK